MRAAVSHGIDGIVGECGGSAVCATCHVYVDAGRTAELTEMSNEEDAMLGCTMTERKANSRLSCQIIVTERLANLIVDLPETQT